LRFKPTARFEGSAFFRVMRPQGVALPMIAMAACLQLDDDKHIQSARVAVAPSGPVPCLVEAAMEALVGGPATKGQFSKASEAALGSMTLRSSKYRASRAYREEMVRSHLPRIMALAAERATSGQAEPRGVGQ
jgi:carbon-monoxide dehydrogenase medium subunit